MARRRDPFPAGTRVRSRKTGETALVLRTHWAQAFVRLEVSRWPDGRVQEFWWDTKDLDPAGSDRT